MPQDELRSRILSGTPTVIVDVRDDDHQGVSEACLLRLVCAPALSIQHGHYKTVQTHFFSFVEQGHIMGSIHMPDGGDWSVQMPRLLSIIECMRDSSALPVTVVFHCMESIRRGPRCARRLFQELASTPAKNVEGDLAMQVTIKVLQGGADQWMRKFYLDSRLVQAYNNDIWGYMDD